MTESPNANEGTGQEPDGPSPAQLVVANHQDAGSDRESTQVEEPARLLRIAAMVRSLLNEVREAELDEAGRRRLADVHSRALAGLRELVSDDLRDELEEVGLDGFGEELPSGPEIRVAQAQLAGWLEGLFRGIQASIATQQMVARAQLAQPPSGDPGTSGGTSSGQYL